MAAQSGDAVAKKKSRRQVGKTPWKTPSLAPDQGHPAPPFDSEETAHRVPEYEVLPARVPQRLRQAANAAGLTQKPELPDAFRHAVQKQGRPDAGPMMTRATKSLVQKGVRFGSGGFDPEEEELDPDAEEQKLKIRLYSDQELRQAFTIFDLNGNDYIDAAELRHIFAQIGEMPTDNEISAMLMLCDPRGEGCVNFDDFLQVFANPADALRNANVKGIKHLLPRKKIDFDIRDPLGLVLEEKVRLKEVSLMVVDARKGSQSNDAGVKPGWKVISLEDIPVTSEKDFDARLSKIENQAKPDDDEDDAGLPSGSDGKKGRGKGRAGAKPAAKPPIKWDYSIVFAVLAGDGDTSSEEEEEEEEEEDIDEEDEEDDEEDA